MSITKIKSMASSLNLNVVQSNVFRFKNVRNLKFTKQRNLHAYPYSKNDGFLLSPLSISRTERQKIELYSNINLKPFTSNSFLKKNKSLPGLVKSFSNDSTVYEGTYGPWKVETSDKIEVFAYRGALVSCALAFLISSSTAFLPEDNQIKSFLISNLDFLYFTGSISLGLSLFLIHIYVTAIKRTLQSLWAVGLAGSVIVQLNYAIPSGESLIQFCIHNNYAIWFVGPLFAALTGLVFKEGLCYGKFEASILFFIIPSLLLGHLSGIMDENVEKTLLALWMLFFSIFASRKFTQPIKDDIGDKSVFIFQSLSSEEQDSLLERLNSSK